MAPGYFTCIHLLVHVFEITSLKLADKSSYYY